MAGDTHPSVVSGVFRRPFREQVAYFRNKLGNLVPTARWDDITREQHDIAFMVAGAQKADLLADLAASVDRTITEGKSLEAFRQDFNAAVARNDWHGWTGEDSKAGRAWRTRTIYRTNATVSYAAGRFVQLQSGNFPWWVYRHGGSKHPRPEHLDWNGLVLANDDPVWVWLYPPSDWGCSCYVLGARTLAGARRLGGDPDKRRPANFGAIDKATGAPVGVGKGWDYAPGASVAGTVAAMAEKVRNWDYRIGKAFLESMPANLGDAIGEAYRRLPSVADDARRAAQRIAEGRTPADPGRTLGLVTTEQADAIRAERSIDVSKFDFSLSPDEIGHVLNTHGAELRRDQRGVTPADFARLPEILSGMPRFAGTSRGHNQPVVEISRTIGGETYVTRWEVWSRRRTLTLLSFFIKVGKGS